MRWPFMNWLRGAPARDDPAPGAPEAAPTAPAGGLSAPPGPGPGPRVESRPSAWRDLAPVQRTVGAAPLTAPSAAFARDLASRRAPDPILAPLGHAVTSDGPAGLVSGITVPLVQRVPSGSDPRVAPPMPSAATPRRGRPSAQRAVTTVATLPRHGAADPGLEAGPDVRGPKDETRADAAEAADAADAADAAPSGISASDAPGPGLRVLPVARLAADTPAIAATRVAATSAPLPVLALARVIASGSPPDGDAAAATPVPATAVATADATLGGQAAGEPAAGSRPNLAEVVPAAPSRPDDHPQAVTRRTLGESRRLGLGAPLVGPPPSATRDAARFDLPVMRRARTGDAMLSTAPDPAALPGMVPAAAASSPLPRLVVARRAATASATTTATIPPIAAPAASGAPGSSAPAVSSGLGSSAPAEQVPSDVAVDSSTDASPGDTAPDAPRPVRPLVGESPIGVARLAREDQDTESDAEAPAEPGVGALQRASSSAVVPGAGQPAGTTGPGWTSAASLRDPSSSGGSEVGGVAAVQRAAAAWAGAGSSAPVPSATRSATPAMAPMVAARAMRSGPTASTAGPARRAVDESTPVIARIALPSFDGGAPYGAPGPDSTWTGHPGFPSAPGGALRRDERPVVSRAALDAGRGPTSAVLSALPVARAAAGAAGPSWASGPDTIPAGPGGALGWTSAAGFTSVAPIPGPSVQRAVQIDEVAVTPDGGGAGAGESGAAAAGQSGSTGAAAAAGGGAGTDYEELADQLYDRIRARLTTELLLDRERAGTLVDA